MDWVLLYLSMFFTTYLQTGMHTTGPFSSESACYTYADSVWLEDEWRKEVDGPNFYDSSSIIHHRESNKSNMVISYTCVRIRPLDK
jgi:hypothetical protein